MNRFDESNALHFFLMSLKKGDALLQALYTVTKAISPGIGLWHVVCV
jgi:hypothetical protein